MIILRGFSDIDLVASPAIRSLLALRLRQLGRITEGLLLVVEPGDSVEAIEGLSRLSVLHDPFEDVPFGHPDFTPNFDYIESHQNGSGFHYCFELHQDTGDEGIGFTLFIPTESGIDARLLALCKTYARPAVPMSDVG